MGAGEPRSGAGTGQKPLSIRGMRSRGRYAKGVAKRQEILHAALEIFARQGYQRTSLRELAERVDLTEAGVLHYFESKEHLFAEVLRTRDEVDTAVYHADEDTLGALPQIMRHNADVPGLVSLYATLSSAAAADPRHSARGFFQERYDMVRRLLAERIRRQQASGSIPAAVDAERLASILVAAADGMQIQWMLDPTYEMAEHIEYLFSLLGISTEPEAPEAPVDAAS